MTDPGELRCYILYQSAPSPLPDKAIGNLFAGFLFPVRRQVWEWVWVGGESPLYFLSQWGEAVYFTLQCCVSNRGNQVHLALGIEADRRTKKLKSRPAKRRALGLSRQQLLPACLSFCLPAAAWPGICWALGLMEGAGGLPPALPCTSSASAPAPCPSMPQPPCLCTTGNEVHHEIRK